MMVSAQNLTMHFVMDRITYAKRRVDAQIQVIAHLKPQFVFRREIFVKLVSAMMNVHLVLYAMKKIV